MTTEHTYLSTACFHAAHSLCRKVCKYCGSPCACTCGRCGIDLESMAPEVARMLESVEKPRANLGNSGPPGRVD